MTVAELFEYVDVILENPFTDNIKRRWLNQIEAEIQVDVLLLAPDGIVKYGEEDNGAELIAPAPYDELYSEYLFWRICLAQHENELADNYAATFNRLYNEYVRFVCETINPGCGMAERLRYYLTAYQIAVKHGYAGTEAEWVDSLKGPEGKPGAGLHILGHVDAETDLPMDPEQGDGYLVGADNLLYIWDGKGWFYKLPLRGEKGDPGKTPQKGVDYWTPEEAAEITAAKNAANTAAGNADWAAGAAQTAAAFAETAAGNANNAASTANTEAKNARTAATAAADAAGNAQTVANEVRQAKENGEFKGDPFTYSDFTQEQLESLHGKAGTVSIISAVGLGPGEQPRVEEWHTSTENNRVYRLGIPEGRKGERGSVVHVYSGAIEENADPWQDPNGNVRFGMLLYSSMISESQWDFAYAGDLVLHKPNGKLYPIVEIDEVGYYVYLGAPAELKGDPFTYDDFTPEQLEELRGPSGTMSFSGAYSLPEGSEPTVEESVFSTEGHRKYFLGIPRGATGDRGERGGVFHFFSGRYIENSGYIEKPDGERVNYRFAIRLSELLRYTTYETVIAGDYVFWKENVGLFPVVHVDEDNVYLGEYVVIKGSDASVTEANIQKALGYKPAKPDDVNELVTQKVDKQQGTENAGKVLGIGDDGLVKPVDAPNAENAVITVKELPEATEESPDLVYLLNDEHGGEGEGGATEETDPTVPDWAKQPQKPGYTASEVGAIPAPATAEVGQVMRVAAVDENGKPAEWEPYKEPDYELIETIVMEEAAVLIRRKEPDGKDYAFSALFFHIKVPIGQTISSGSFMFHKKIAGTGVEKYFAHRWTAEVKGDATKPLAYAGRVYREKGMWCWYLPGDFKVDAGSPIMYDEARADITDITEDGTISYIYFSHTFPAGTEIKIYGVRA